MASKYTFGRLSDAQILRLADRLFGTFNVGSYSVTIGDMGNISVSKSKGEGTVETGLSEFSGTLKEDTYFITEMTWQAGSSSHKVRYLRSKRIGINPNNNAEIWVNSDNPFIDGMEVTSSTENAPLLLGIIHSFISMAPPIVGSPETGSALDQSQAILNRVSSAIVTLVEHTSERQQQLDQTRATLARDAEKAVKAIRGEADEKIKGIEANYEIKRQELVAREAELDDRANTHVRREFAKQMAALSDTQLKENLLTKSRTSFWVPLAICVVPVIILAYVVSSELGFIGIFANSIAKIAVDGKLNADEKTILIGNVNYQILYAQIRIVLQSLGIAALVWFALRMASSRYSLVSGWERDLHRFRLDTERAGFLVEGDLEARKVNQEGLPDVLLESFSRNLFSSSDSAHGPTSSEGLGGALNALLGQAAKVRVGSDGVNVEVEGRGIRKARKLIEDE
jgi:hypothetical protein